MGNDYKEHLDQCLTGAVLRPLRSRRNGLVHTETGFGEHASTWGAANVLAFAFLSFLRL
jgi:hypothetical protein